MRPGSETNRRLNQTWYHRFSRGYPKHERRRSVAGRRLGDRCRGEPERNGRSKVRYPTTRRTQPVRHSEHSGILPETRRGNCVVEHQPCLRDPPALGTTDGSRRSRVSYRDFQRLSLLAFLPLVLLRSSAPPRRSRFMVPRSWLPKPWPSNTPKHLAFPFGSIAAVCWREAANLEQRNKEFFLSGYTLGVRDGRFDTSGLVVTDSKFGTLFIPMTWLTWSSNRCNLLGSGSPRICNVAGGLENSMSLYELSKWCSRSVLDLTR